MSADINKLKGTLEDEYGVKATVEDNDTIRLHNVTEDVNVNDVAKLASTRGFDVYPEGGDTEVVTFPSDFTVER